MLTSAPTPRSVDELGRQLGVRTTTATSRADHLELMRWADQFGPDRTWAVEDCRHLSRQLERDMLAAGERLVRVPPKMMAHAREAARTYGKSDPIDALAVAREVRLLVDHREDLIGERTRHINRLRWHLHEIDPTWDPKQRALTTMKHLAQTQQRLAETTTVVAKIAAELVDRIRALTVDINALEAELGQRTTAIAPTLREVHGVAAVSAAKFIGEVAGVGRSLRVRVS